MPERRSYHTIQAGRAFAAVAVVLYHVALLIADPHHFGVRIAGGIFEAGASGVSFFFVLSGFVIYLAHEKDVGRSDRLLNYFQRRAERLLPVYWLINASMLPLYFMFPSLGSGSETTPATLATSFLLIGSGSTILAVAWTLLHEVVFYVVFAFAIAYRRIGIAIGVGWITVCATSLKVGYALAFINVLFGFGVVAGWLLDRWVIKRPMAALKIGASLFVAIALISAAVGHYEVARHPPVVTLALGVAASLALLGAIQAERRCGLVVPAPFRFLGDASYSIYLAHYPVIALAAKLLGGFSAWVTFLGLFAAGICSGVALYLVAERPIMAAFKRSRRDGVRLQDRQQAR